MAIKVMLVEDEANIRKILRKVVEKNENFMVISESDNMTDALLQFNTNKPQVVFMDIEINDSSGIDCAKVMCNMEPETRVIFATAHSEYMSNAFEMYAFDYLTKPFNIERIGHTLERLEKQLLGNEKDFSDTAALESIKANDVNMSMHSDKKEMMDEKSAAHNDASGQLLIKNKESLNFIDMAEIVFIEREKSSTIIYTRDGEDYTTSMSLAELEERLDMKRFIRSHKSYILNLSYIKKIEPYGRWTYIVKFKGIQKDALLTKEKYDQIKQLYA